MVGVELKEEGDFEKVLKGVSERFVECDEGVKRAVGQEDFLKARNELLSDCVSCFKETWAKKDEKIVLSDMDKCMEAFHAAKIDKMENLTKKMQAHVDRATA